ncbi:GntR family transcriptional regulator [Mediterraneibacter glycyrrhizinilyticus]|jgi:DNA-binding GntR family transcriptional regulator|uniref:GntR family transcriptional regulator n=1 Tax=Mediterraneibacter glycyrrhizinilyticus TaxID=342942 RepID=UPI0025A345E5|nr:GntR family transcriptional regulator [Mediterraneibacter glycyrrhizinilyticus]MDM8124657.1 GntR family transcriptional regulator [Mediterraneibacter glycyrrhizinilyticus]
MATLSEQAYEKIREMVLKAEPGTFLSVRKCAADLGFSYTPTREALRRLNAEGMLELVPKVGFFTARMDLRDITDIYQSRECIEQYVLPIVITKLTDKDKKYLWIQIDRQEKALNDGDIEQYNAADTDFHCYLINLLNNRRLSEFYDNIRTQYRAASNSVVTDHNLLPIQEHKTFMTHIENGEYEEAMQVIKQHTKDAIKRMQDGFVRIGA